MFVFDKSLAGTDSGNQRNMAAQYAAVNRLRASVQDSQLFSVPPSYGAGGVVATQALTLTNCSVSLTE